MRQLHFQNLVSKGERIKKSRSVVLTERDLLIIEYILDMKFASIQNIFDKFFKITFSGEPARSSEWTVRRLQQLASAGFVTGIHSFSLREKFYLATMKGYFAVRDSNPGKIVLKPSHKIDHQTFTHDRLVLESRIILENQRAATCWISDKKLRSASELAGGLTLSNVPDGIFIDPNNLRVALEIEASPKSRPDRQRKIAKYVQMLRSSDPKVKVFDRVWYVCALPQIVADYTDETRIYGDLFRVQHLGDFLEMYSRSATSGPRTPEGE